MAAAPWFLPSRDVRPATGIFLGTRGRVGGPRDGSQASRIISPKILTQALSPISPHAQSHGVIAFGWVPTLNLSVTKAVAFLPTPTPTFSFPLKFRVSLGDVVPLSYSGLLISSCSPITVSLLSNLIVTFKVTCIKGLISSLELLSLVRSFWVTGDVWKGAVGFQSLLRFAPWPRGQWLSPHYILLFWPASLQGPSSPG